MGNLAAMRVLLMSLALFVLVPAPAQETDKHLEKARQLLARNKPYKVRAMATRWRRVHTDAPGRAEIGPYYADALNRIAEHDAAAAVCRQDLGAAPHRDRDLLIQWGIALNGMGRWDSALVVLEQARGMGGADQGVLSFALGRAYQGKHRWQEALAAYDGVIASDTTDRRAYRERGICKAMLGDTASARRDLDNALQLGPKDPVSWNSRGYFKAQYANDHRGAIADFNGAIKMDPNYSYAFNNRGWSWFQLGEVDKAMRDIDLARRKKARNPVIYRNLGMIALAQGDTVRACGEFRTALEMGFTTYHGDEVEHTMKAICGGRTLPPAPTMVPAVGGSPQNKPPPRTNAP